ncbi:MAG: MYXO-CTERM sorting domain-containing protein, partial [Minicystis sp.]
KVELRLLVADLGGKSAPEALCFTVTTVDAAGNVAPSISEVPIVICKPCNYRVTDAPLTGFGPPPEPMWNSGDVYAGGPCDPHVSAGAGGNFPDAGLTSGSGGSGGGTGGGGSDQAIGGCSCQVGDDADGAGASFAGIALLAGAMARVGRRRRAR